MKINPVDNVPFKLNRTSKTIYRNTTKTISDIIQLQNGNKVVVSKTYNKFGVMTEKLQYLKDSTGEWVKSKLQYFQGKQVVKTLKGHKKIFPER